MKTTYLFPMMLMALLAACASEPVDGTGDPIRGGLGKADLVGSCQAADGGDFCGGPSDGSCWCDDACDSYGDCCSDKAEVCEPQGQSCGGFAGLTCPQGQYCSYAPEQACGGADQLGVCVPQPEVCAQIYDPVCGCDGQTYSNACHAAAAGTSVASAGECPVANTCVRTGCSGQICADEPTFSTCEFRPWYACFGDASCEPQQTGECGWTADSELLSCVEQHGGPACEMAGGQCFGGTVNCEAVAPGTTDLGISCGGTGDTSPQTTCCG